MTDSELLVIGELCQALLTSSQFSEVVAQFEQSIAADIISTKPDEAAKRERLYASLWGSRDLMSFMKLNADAAATIKEPKPPTDDTTEYATPSYAFDEQYDDEGFSVSQTEENE